MTYLQIISKYKQALKDDIFDLSEKGWDVLSFVIVQYKTRNSGLGDIVNNDFYSAREMAAEAEQEKAMSDYWADYENGLI